MTFTTPPQFIGFALRSGCRINASTLLVSCLLLTGHVCLAEESVLTPVADATIYFESSDATNLAKGNGGGPTLFVGRTASPEQSAGYLRRSLLRFDLTAVFPANTAPADIVLQAAEVTVQVDKEAVGPDTAIASLHRVTTPWTFANSHVNNPQGSLVPALAGDATWYYSSFSTQRWTTPGGDFTAGPSATTPLGAADSQGLSVWETTSELLADVQSWLDSPDSNFGWIIVGDEATTQSAKRLLSSESTVANSRPSLRLTYDLLTPGDIDGDRRVDISDFVVLRRNFGTSALTRAQGDLNKDSRVDLSDFIILRNNFGRLGGAPASAVPEPAQLGWLAFSGLAAVLAVVKRCLRR